MWPHSGQEGVLGGDKQTALDPKTMSPVCYLMPGNVGPSLPR